MVCVTYERTSQQQRRWQKGFITRWSLMLLHSSPLFLFKLWLESKSPSKWVRFFMGEHFHLIKLLYTLAAFKNRYQRWMAVFHVANIAVGCILFFSIRFTIFLIHFHGHSNNASTRTGKEICCRALRWCVVNSISLCVCVNVWLSPHRFAILSLVSHFAAFTACTIGYFWARAHLSRQVRIN